VVHVEARVHHLGCNFNVLPDPNTIPSGASWR
jgi:hypothetical protein